MLPYNPHTDTNTTGLIPVIPVGLTIPFFIVLCDIFYLYKFPFPALHYVIFRIHFPQIYCYDYVLTASHTDSLKSTAITTF